MLLVEVHNKSSFEANTSVFTEEFEGGDEVLAQGVVAFASEGELLSRSPLAYDVRHDIARFNDLKRVIGEERAKTILRLEVEDDLATHFNEVGGERTRVKYFEYTYSFDEHGRLKESTEGGELVAAMFAGQEYEVVGWMWLNRIIPFLERSKVGQSVFTLSAKNKDSIQFGHEAAYDFGYFFIKTSESTVNCYAVELDLHDEEQQVIVNRQLKRKGKLDQLLSASDSWKAVRGRAIFYEPNEYSNFPEMFHQIVGLPLEELRGSYDLADKNYLSAFILHQKAEALAREMYAKEIAVFLVEMISLGVPAHQIQQWLGEEQVAFLKAIDPMVYEQGLEDGYVMLACGALVFNSSLAQELFTEGGFHCPSCTGFIPWGSGDICPNCGHTKYAEAAKTGEICA